MLEKKSNYRILHFRMGSFKSELVTWSYHFVNNIFTNLCAENGAENNYDVLIAKEST